MGCTVFAGLYSDDPFLAISEPTSEKILYTYRRCIIICLLQIVCCFFFKRRFVSINEINTKKVKQNVMLYVCIVNILSHDISIGSIGFRN